MYSIPRGIRAAILCVFVGAIFGLLGGCRSVSTSTPLIHPSRATLDGRLLGAWVEITTASDTPQQEKSRFRIRNSDQGSHPAGIMMLSAAPALTPNARQEKNSSAYFVTATIPGPSGVSYSYLSVFSAEEEVAPSSPCLLIRYLVNNDTLTIYFADADAARDLIRRRQIASELSSGDAEKASYAVFERDSLVDYLQQHDGNRLFPESNKVQFQRTLGTASLSSSSPVVLSPASRFAGMIGLGIIAFSMPWLIRCLMVVWFALMKFDRQ